MSKRKQKYKAEWEDDNDARNERIGSWSRASPSDAFSGHCIFCDIDISVANAGKYALVQHANRKKHINASKSRQSQLQLLSFTKPLAPKIDDKVLQSEMHWALFSAEHDLSANLSEDIGNLIGTLCPDSEIAKRFTCGRTKNSYLITDGFYPSFHERLVSSLRSHKFSLMLDESNKKHQTKFLHMLVRFMSDDKPVTMFYKAAIVNQATATTSYVLSRMLSEKTIFLGQMWCT